MRFGFSEDQLQLTAAVRQLLDGELSPQVRGSAEAGARRGALWKALAEQGIFALLVPEEHDGLGLTELDAAGVLEELGRAAAPGPVAETAFIAPRLLAGSPEHLQALAAGQLAVAVTALPGGYAAHADVADLVIVLAEEEVRVVPGDAAGLAVQPQADQTRPLAAVPGGQGTVLATGADARELAAAARSYGAVATAAQLVGAAPRLLDDTIRYAGQRHQFGHPIGSFQAVKHQLADVAVAVAFARPLVHRACYSLCHRLPTSARDASAAKAAAADASELAARVALQMHGAIGYTEEAELQVWLKRVWALVPEWGDAHLHRQQVAAGLLDEPPLPRVP
jgi:alkylation response protein AidB-like acyl-CoA dehydrogenase